MLSDNRAARLPLPFARGVDALASRLTSNPESPGTAGNEGGRVLTWAMRPTRPVPNAEEPDSENTHHQGKVGAIRDQPQVARDGPDRDEVHDSALCLADGVARQSRERRSHANGDRRAV